MITISLSVPEAVAEALDRGARELGVLPGEYGRAIFQTVETGHGPALRVALPGPWSVGVRGRHGAFNGFVLDYLHGAVTPDTPSPPRVAGFFHPEDAPIWASWSDLEIGAAGRYTGKLSASRRLRRRRGGEAVGG